MLAVGEYLWGGVDEMVLRMSSGLAGGVGCSHEELCGALSGGAMLIGGVCGRSGPEQDDADCNRLVCAYRDMFTAEFGTTRCFDLRESGFGSEGEWPCSTLVERAAGMLLEVLAEAGSWRSTTTSRPQAGPERSGEMPVSTSYSERSSR